MNYHQQFQEVNRLLEQTRQWWQFAAFHDRQSRWKQISPQLDKRLNQARLGYEDFNREQLSVLQQLLDELIPQLNKLKELTKLPKSDDYLEAPDSHWQYQIAGRKWSQIKHFAAHVPKHKNLLEWCAGKGHLGRLVASQGAQSLISVEWQQALCEKNHSLNLRLDIDKNYCPSCVLERDVLSEKWTEEYPLSHYALALHACGDLHTHLVKLVAEKQTEGICLAPCCYNLIKKEYYQPLSWQAKKSDLQLSRLDLSLPLRQLVTAGEREQREQKQERLWRIAFDCWQRNKRNIDQYMPLPTIPKKILKGSFSDFILWAATEKSIDVSSSVLVDETLMQAQKRLPVITQMEWVQFQFQRAIEVWLLLDQVLFLEANGYMCDLFEFCEKSLTPRNLMLRADKRSC